MAKELSPSDKFQKRNRSELQHPGTCLACGSGNCDDGYVDLGTYFDYEGQMYLCLNCMQEAAEVAGMLVIAESEFLQRQNQGMALKLRETEEALTYANQRLRAYDDVLSHVRSNLADAESASMAAAQQRTADDSQLDLFDANAIGSAVSGESESEESTTSGSGLTGTSQPERSDEGSAIAAGVSI